MRRRNWVVFAGVLTAVSGVVAFAALSLPADEASSAEDPRQNPPLVRVAAVASVSGTERGFTGVVGARVQSSLGFRVPGKIVERYVDAGEQVEAGQALMRIDDTDLRLALAARQSAVEAAWAILVQAQAEEERYAALSRGGIGASEERYEQAKAALDTATAQLAAAQAEARIAENEAAYAILRADADGTVVETLGEPGQVIAAGQTVVRLAHTGPREAIVYLPETVRPALGSLAGATLYRTGEQRYTAMLRQLSDTADPLTRTYEARYVLEGDAARAPLGATVTIRIADEAGASVAVPIGALLDDGARTGVWVVDADQAQVTFRPVVITRLGEEIATVTGLDAGEPVVALGAHLLSEGQSVRTNLETTVAAQ